MQYSAWLFGFSFLFVLLERVWPQTRRSVLRKGIWTDVAYIVFNGHYVGLIVASLLTSFFSTIPNLRAAFELHLLSAQPLWVQFVVLLISFDFLQWCIHNLLHRVPFLWEFHKVHHSIEEMDWIGNWRFHCFEVLAYQLLLYPFAAALFVDGRAMFGFAVVSTFAGHYAHANVTFSIGRLRFLFNSPQMHAWHHTHPDCGPSNKNFGITFSVWDWLFGTAYMPSGELPVRLGFHGVESYPSNPLSQLVIPLAASVARKLS